MSATEIKPVYPVVIKYFQVSGKSQVFFGANLLAGFLLTAFNQGLFYLLVSGGFTIIVLFVIAKDYAKQKRTMVINNVSMSNKDILWSVGSFYGLLWFLAMFIQVIGMILGW